VLPWLTATGAQVGINLDLFSTQVQSKTSVVGLDKGVGSILAFILVAAAFALIASSR
jgi:hypothetical protein